MSIQARAASFVGTPDQFRTTAVAASLNLSDTQSVFFLTGTATVTALNPDNMILPGRTVMLVQDDAGTSTFTNTNGATAKGTMDLGGGNVVLGQADILVLVQKRDGAWLRVTSVNN